jgi:hypothetical protein
MNAEILSLVNKEWRERRMSFAVCGGWMLACALYVVAYEWTHEFRAPVASFYGCSHLYALFAAVFLAMRTALGEPSLGVQQFSLSLPVSRSRLAWVRLAGGAATLVVPIVVAAVVVTLFIASGFIENAALRLTGGQLRLPDRSSMSAADATGLLWTVAAVAIASGLQLFLVLSVWGARRSSEAQIGFAGAVLALGWTLLPGARMMSDSVSGWIGSLLPASLIVHYSYSTENGSYGDLDIARPLWMPLAINTVLLLFLAWWFTRRFGSRTVLHSERRAVRWRRWPAVWSRVPLPLVHPVVALVWINLRQSVPLAIAGLFVAVLITLSQISEFETGQNFRSQLPSSTWFVATLWGAIVGVGIFAAELQADLGSFWRSRPITVGGWFWCKFVTGLLAVLVVLDGTTAVVSWGTPVGNTTGLSWAYLACMPMVHATLYALAVLGICLTRRPILGATLAIAGYFVTSTVLTSIFGEHWDPIHIHNCLLGDEMQGALDLAQHGYPLVYGLLGVIIALSAWLALRAIRAPEQRWQRAGRSARPVVT